MTTLILRNALILLPSMPTFGSRGSNETTQPTAGFRLPRWERHPLNRSEQSPGSMDPEWIRIHLP